MIRISLKRIFKLLDLVAPQFEMGNMRCRPSCHSAFWCGRQSKSLAATRIVHTCQKRDGSWWWHCFPKCLLLPVLSLRMAQAAFVLPYFHFDGPKSSTNFCMNDSLLYLPTAIYFEVNFSWAMQYNGQNAKTRKASVPFLAQRSSSQISTHKPLHSEKGSFLDRTVENYNFSI